MKDQWADSYYCGSENRTYFIFFTDNCKWGADAVTQIIQKQNYHNHTLRTLEAAETTSHQALPFLAQTTQWSLGYEGGQSLHHCHLDPIQDPLFLYNNTMRKWTNMKHIHHMTASNITNFHKLVLTPSH